MAIPKRGNGISVRGSGGSGGGEISVNDHTGETISSGVRTIEWQTLDEFGFTVQVDPDDESKVIVGTAPVFLDSIIWSSGQPTSIRVSESDPAEPDAFLTDGKEGTVMKGSLGNFIYNSTLGTGFGAEASLQVKTYHAGTLVDDETFPCAANGSTTAGNITVTISGYAPDGDGSVSQGQFNVVVDSEGVIGSTNSGVCRVEISFTEQKFNNVRTINEDVFKDKDPATPFIDGGKYIQETRQLDKRVLKYLSGIAYFDVGTEYEITVGAIRNHNEDSSKPTDSLFMDTSQFGIIDYYCTPYNQPDEFSLFTNVDTLSFFHYYEERPQDMRNYRHIGNSSFKSNVSDSWNTSANIESNVIKMCIDTVTNPSTDLVEYFDEENKRLDNDYTAAWDSERYCVDGEGVVYGGALYQGSDLPRITEGVAGALGTLGSLTSSVPNEDAAGLSRQNPNYVGFTKDAVFLRKFIAPNNSISYQSMNISAMVTGKTFSDALKAGDIIVYIWKISSSGASNNARLPVAFTPANMSAGLDNSIWVNGDTFSFGTFDDGDSGTSAGSACVRKFLGNTVEATFGGFNCEEGIYARIQTKKGVELKELSVTFI